MSKKGVSDVITTVLMILIVLAAIGIVWAVVSSFLNNSTEQIDLGAGFSQIDIVDNSIKYLPSDVLELKVKRDSNPGNISGLRVIVESVEGNVQSYDIETSVKELETKTIDVQLQGKITNISKVSIAPRTPIKNKIKTGQTADEQSLGKSVVGNEGLVLYLPFDNDFQDHSGSNLLVNNSGAKSAGGKIGNAYDFNGIYGMTTGSYMNVQDDSKLDITGELTVSAWIYPKSISGPEGRTVLSKYDFGGGNEKGWNFGLDWVGNWFHFQINQPNGTRLYASNGTFFIGGLNKWTNVVGVYKPNTYIRLYQNGVLINEQTISVPALITYSAASDPVIIGRRSVQPQSHFNGTIDEVRIYNRSLSPQEVYYLYKYN